MRSIYTTITRRDRAAVRAGLDLTNESVGKKIRQAEVDKVPYMVVVGEKELESGKITPRVRRDRGGEVGQIEIDRFIQVLASEAKTRASKSTLELG